MKSILCVFFGACILCGCAANHAYRAVLTVPGYDPRETDELVALPLGQIEGITVDRTVASQGQVEVYLRSSLGEAETGRRLADHRLPRDTTITALDRVRGELPAPPAVSMVPRVTVRVDREQCTALGVSASAVAARARAVASTGAGGLERATVPAASGWEVRLVDVATVTVEQVPSHIVREP